MKILHIARLFTSTVVVVLLLCATGLSIHKALFLRRALTIQGEVTANVAKVDSEVTVNYCPHFTFSAADGRSYDIASSTCTNPPSFISHEKIKVVFDPADPGGAEIDAFFQVWFVPLVLCFIAMAWLFFTAILLFFERRARKRTTVPA